MRLDKWLKLSRIIKRRSVAKGVCDRGRIYLNGTIGKASHTVHKGDLVELHMEKRVRRFEVLEVNPILAETSHLYT